MGTLRRIPTDSDGEMAPSEQVEDLPPRNAIDPSLEDSDRRSDDELQPSNGGNGVPQPYPAHGHANVYPGPYPPNHNGYWHKQYTSVPPGPPPPPMYYVDSAHYDYRKPAPYPPPHIGSRYAHHYAPGPPGPPPPIPHPHDQYPAPYDPYLQITYTEDASTKLSDRVRRRCYNCATTDTSTWRRSTLSPGKVLCNKCGLFERTHRRRRPEQLAQEKRRPPPVSDKHSSEDPRQDGRYGPSGSGMSLQLNPPPPMSAQSASAPVPQMTYTLPPPPPPHDQRRFSYESSPYGGPTLPPLVNQRADTPPPRSPPPPFTRESASRPGSPPKHRRKLSRTPPSEHDS